MLLNNERFRQEYKLFENKISSITDDKLKNELTQLLQAMMKEARSIDQHHEELFKGTRLATDSVTTHRSTLTAIRQKISKKLEGCEKSGLIKS